MKKTVKLFALLLAVVLMAQVAPLSAIGDTVSSDPYEAVTSDETNETAEPESPETEEPETDEPDTEEPETEAPETEEPETEEPETDEPEIETPASEIAIEGIAWMDALNGDSYQALTDGQSVNCNYIYIRLTLNAEPASVEASVDGVAVTPEINGAAVLLPIELLNGYHTFSFTVNGAANSVTQAFGLTVAGTDGTYPEISVSGASAMILGESNVIVITGQNMGALSEILVNITMPSSFKVESVDIAKGFTGMYSWYRGELKLVIEVFDDTKINGDVMATIRVKAPVTVKSDEELFWGLDSAVVTPAEGETVGNTEHFQGTVTAPEVEVTVNEAYTIEGLTSYAIGNMDYTLNVKNSLGEAAAGVSVYVLQGKKNVLVGVTDENGSLTSNYFSGKGSYQVYAEDENGCASYVYSFNCYDAVGAEDGTPYSILFNGVVEGGKNLSWMSNITASKEIAAIRIATSADMADATVYNGVSEVKLYNTSLAINRVNTVSVSDLTPGVYYYQVGDGNVWSEVKAFTVKAASESVSFAVIGDMTNTDAASLGLIAGALNQSGIEYNFAIQTGNAISNVDEYDAWNNAANAFGSFGDLDIIHTLGQNELSMGTAYDAEEPYRTYVYGNVFVAVINYTEDAVALSDMLNDMVWDSRNADYAWRILAINQAPYSTDSEKADSIAAELVPEMAERAGIDLVLSGNECNYARTDSLRAGIATEMNGVTYVVCGSAGDKGNAITNNEFVATAGDYNVLYLSVTANADDLNVTAYSILEDGTIEIVDSFSKIHSVCGDSEHIFRMGVNIQYVVCDYCGAIRRIGEYVGLAIYRESLIYIEKTGFGIGWREFNGNVYYFSPNNMRAVDGEQTIGGYTYVFENCILTEGCWSIQNGVKRLFWAGSVLTNTWHTQGGVTYYFLENGACATGEVEIPEVNEDGETVTATYLFDEDGALIGKL